MRRCCEAIIGAVPIFDQAVSNSALEPLRLDVSRLADVRTFLRAAAAHEGSAAVFVRALLARHDSVQRGKFDQGRRKLPWIEVAADRFTLTLSQVGDVRGEPTMPEDIRPHEYRLAVAERFLAASQGAAA